MALIPAFRLKGTFPGGSNLSAASGFGCGLSFSRQWPCSVNEYRKTAGCEAGHTPCCKLLIKTKMARIDGSVYKLFEQLSKTDLLIMDDFGLTHLEKQQQMDLMEIIEDRHARKATIIASQLPVASWYDIIGEETIADAILDRLVHTSHRIELKGESLRKKSVILSCCLFFEPLTARGVNITETGGQHHRNIHHHQCYGLKNYPEMFLGFEKLLSGQRYQIVVLFHKGLVPYYVWPKAYKPTVA